MPVSPADFAIWARATGNKYPETAEEKIAAAPHAYHYAKNIGKSGVNAPGARVGGSIFYEQPENVQNRNPDSLFNAPVTPDNAAPKVAGTYEPTLTSEHFVNQEAHEQVDRNRQHSLIDVIGKTALAAGTVAAGVALARNPGVQQAVRTAGTTIKENAQDIGDRVSSFLGGLGGGRYADPDVVRNSGDVTPPTTSQQYHQLELPIATQEAQVAKGAPTGSRAESTLPTTTESYQTKPVTESEIITSSQTFSPNNQAKQLSLLSDTPDPWTNTYTATPTKTQLIQKAIAIAKTNYPTGQYVPDIPNPYELRGPEFQRTFGTAPVELQEARRAISRGEPNPLAGKPLVDPFTGEIRNPSLSVPGYSEAFPEKIGLSTSQYEAAPSAALSEQTSTLAPSASEKAQAFIASLVPNPNRMEKHSSGFIGPLPAGSGVSRSAGDVVLTSRGGMALSPTAYAEVAKPVYKGIVRIPGAEGQESAPTVRVQRPFVEEAVPYAGARDVVTEPAKKLQIQTLPGARDVEAAIATQQSQGVFPSGTYSSTKTGEQYIPAWGAVSGIDPRVMTAGRQGYGERSMPEELTLKGLTSRIEAAETDPTHPDAGKVKSLKTLLKQAQSLYEITEDPSVIEAANVGALPIKVQLPGGEVAATKAFYQPFKAVDAGEGSNLTQVQSLENQLLGAQTVHSNTQKLALSQLGISTPNLNLTPQQFAALPSATQKQLYRSHSAVKNLQAQLKSAKSNQYLFSIPDEVLQGTKMAPVISQLTGDISGFTPVPENRAITPGERFSMMSSTGISRHDVGGVGRRQEELSSAHGIEELPEMLSTLAGGDVTPIMYKDVDTGTFVHPDEVNTLAIATGRLRAVTGQTASAQRMLGKSDRPYRGLEAVTPASFDPEQRKQLAENYPERVTPEGLIYSQQVVVSPTAAGKQAKEILGWEKEQTAQRKSGRRDLSVFAGKLKQIAANKKAVPGSEQGVNLASMTDDQLNEAIMQAQFAGMSDVAEAASKVLNARTNVKTGAKAIALAEQARREALATPSPGSYATGYRSEQPRIASMPESQTIQLEEPKHYIASRESSTGERIPTWYVHGLEGSVPPARPSQQKLLFEQATRPDQFVQTELRLPGQPGKPGVRMTSINMQAYPTPFTRWTDYIDRALTVNPQTPMQWLSTAQEKALQRPAVYQPRLF